MRKYLYRLATDEADGLLPALLKTLLLILSLIYGIFVRVILFCYKTGIFRKYALPKPVISIGNMTLGGVGKTPLIELIAKFMQEKKLKPVILSRGYGKKESLTSDEADVLTDSLKGVPVLEGKNRVEIGEQAMEKYRPDVFLLDDGFQHWRLARDLDIVLIDCDKPFGNGCLMPRGILREPLSSLRRARVFVLTKTDLGKGNLNSVKAKLSAINPNCPVVETIHKPAALFDLGHHVAGELSFLKGKAVCSFCGIGDPKSFEYSLRQLGADLKKNFAFMDHHIYTSKDVETIVRYCKQNDVHIAVTTQKDAVKLNGFVDEFQASGMALLSLKIAIEIVKGKDEFFSRISRICNC